MKTGHTLLSLAAALLACVGCLSAQHSTEKQELITLSETWMRAVERKDRAELERLVTEDFYLTAPGSLDRTPRDEWLENAVKFTWDSMQYHNVDVLINGDTAIVTSVLDFRVFRSSWLPLSSNSQIVDVWVKRDGQWRVTARYLGESSLGNNVRSVIGAIAGLGAGAVIWMLLGVLVRRRRSGSARGN